MKLSDHVHGSVATLAEAHGRMEAARAAYYAATAAHGGPRELLTYYDEPDVVAAREALAYAESDVVDALALLMANTTDAERDALLARAARNSIW